MALTIQWRWTGKQQMLIWCGSKSEKLSSSLNLLSEKGVLHVHLGQTMHIISCNQELSEWNSRAFGVIFLVIQYHELELWTLELNSALAPGSAIYSLCSKKSYLIFLSQYFLIYTWDVIVLSPEGRDKVRDWNNVLKSVAHGGGSCSVIGGGGITILTGLMWECWGGWPVEGRCIGGALWQFAKP